MDNYMGVAPILAENPEFDACVCTAGTSECFQQCGVAILTFFRFSE